MRNNQRSPLPLAKQEDFIKFGAKYRLQGHRFLALKGAIANSPEKGTDDYNKSVITLLRKSSRHKENIKTRFANNRRVQKIIALIESGETIKETLTKTEQVIFYAIF